MLFGKPNYRVTSSSRRPSSFDYPKPPLQFCREKPTQKRRLLTLALVGG
jgi:hypothetical protein